MGISDETKVATIALLVISIKLDLWSVMYTDAHIADSEGQNSKIITHAKKKETLQKYRELKVIIIIIVFIQSKDKNTYPKLQWKSIKRYTIKYNSNIR